MKISSFLFRMGWPAPLENDGGKETATARHNREIHPVPKLKLEIRLETLKHEVG
jgi:hypothetical protein